MKYWVGIDLHSNNSFIGIIDKSDRKIFRKRVPNEVATILGSLKPFKKTVDSVVVESTFNWYWLVDELMKNGYKVKLANPAATLIWLPYSCLSASPIVTAFGFCE